VVCDRAFLDVGEVDEGFEVNGAVWAWVDAFRHANWCTGDIRRRAHVAKLMTMTGGTIKWASADYNASIYLHIFPGVTCPFHKQIRIRSFNHQLLLSFRFSILYIHKRSSTFYAAVYTPDVDDGYLV